jgi:hypothetical protein
MINYATSITKKSVKKKRPKVAEFPVATDYNKEYPQSRSLVYTHYDLDI